MAGNFTEYRIKKQFASIDRLITELVITRKYIYSAKIGLTSCREHLSRASEAGGEVDLMKSQEQLLSRLRLVERRIKRQLRDSSRKLGDICEQERAVR
jgi:hypothetical protein